VDVNRGKGGRGRGRSHQRGKGGLRQTKVRARRQEILCVLFGAWGFGRMWGDEDGQLFSHLHVVDPVLFSAWGSPNARVSDVAVTHLLLLRPTSGLAPVGITRLGARTVPPSLWSRPRWLVARGWRLTAQAPPG
jgi:hypothetical protein